jgi:hypothetical protein
MRTVKKFSVDHQNKFKDFKILISLLNVNKGTQLNLLSLFMSNEAYIIGYHLI